MRKPPAFAALKALFCVTCVAAQQASDPAVNSALPLNRLRFVLEPASGYRGGRRDERQRPLSILAFAPRDLFQPLEPANAAMGFFQPGARDLIVLGGLSAEGRMAAHEYAHLALAQSGFRLPVWLAEGLAELYSGVVDGRSEPRTDVGQFIPATVLSLRSDDWIDLEQLLTNPRIADAAYAESWLLAHMLVFDPRYDAKFPKLLEALGNSDVAEAFGQAYGKSIFQVEEDLKAYLEEGPADVRILPEKPRRGERR